MSIKSRTDTGKEGEVIHHVYHRPESDDRFREVMLNTGMFSIALSSNDKKETLEYLSVLALRILDRLKKE